MSSSEACRDAGSLEDILSKVDFGLIRKVEFYMSFWGLLTWIKSLWLGVWVGQLCVRLICYECYLPKSWCPIDTASLVSSKVYRGRGKRVSNKEVIESQVSHRR
jgi:hypothetical protein